MSAPPIVRVLALAPAVFLIQQPWQISETVSAQIQQHDLAGDGQSFLLKESGDATFFMLGELHGENEIPALIRRLWPSMWRDGYRHVAAEVSPWAADRLEFPSTGPAPFGLWTQPEATFVSSLKQGQETVLWGCDIEEGQPHLLLRDVAALNPADDHLQIAVGRVRDGYQRRVAPLLLADVQAAAIARDRVVDGISLRASLVQTMEVEAHRSAGATLAASARREAVMKDLFKAHWKAAAKTPKVFLRFGRNHLHRGIDRRGVSTLGNFVSEVAAAEHLSTFNVAAFAGGGTIALAGPPEDADERGDDPAFAYLASIARYPATVFDLRPIRSALHRVAADKRSALETSLVYWADSYDAIVYYQAVTPLTR